MFSLLFLLAAPADAATMRATFEVTEEGLRFVRGTRLEGEAPNRPGEVEVIDAEGSVVATTEMPPLSKRRAVVTPEGHDVGHVHQRYVRVDMPWPESAAGFRVGPRSMLIGDGMLPPPGDPPVAVIESGKTSERLDLVVFAEGYQEDDEAKFEQHVDYLTDHLSSIEPYSNYIGLINIWRVFTPSNDEGLDSRDTTAGNPDEVDTYWECYRGCSGIGRLICCDEDYIVDQVDELAPFADGVLILVNDAAYGGSGGFVYSTAYTGDPQALQVAAHELGHTLFLLWDEYVYPGLEPDGEYVSPNCAPPDTVVPWQRWIGADNPDVGAYDGCSFSTWQRPTPANCMMNQLSDHYCPVCREHLVRRIYERVGGGVIVNASPEVGKTRLKDGAGMTFTAETIIPPENMKITWTLGDDVVAEDTLTYELEACSGVEDTLILTVEDTTPWVRYDPKQVLVESVSWRIRADSCEPGANSCGCSSNSTGGALLFLLPLFLRRRR